MRLAVVTAAYPAARRFFKDFFCSLAMQTDQKFDLWVGLDDIDPICFEGLAKAGQKLNLVKVDAHSNPIIVRNKILGCALQNCDAVALVDIDDLLLPSRIEAAKSFAEKFDLSATSMNFIDAEGRPISGIFDPSSADPDLLLNNAFGFSNTTWRSKPLSDLLPVPDCCVTMDWYVSTLAKLSGVSVGFDKIPRMLYRQHSANLANVRPPFTKEQVLFATKLVLKHFSLVINTLGRHDESGYSKKIVVARRRIEHFAVSITDPRLLEEYVFALNKLPADHVWWSCVAHSTLEGIWKKLD